MQNVINESPSVGPPETGPSTWFLEASLGPAPGSTPPPEGEDQPPLRPSNLEREPGSPGRLRSCGCRGPRRATRRLTWRERTARQGPGGRELSHPAPLSPALSTLSWPRLFLNWPWRAEGERGRGGGRGGAGRDGVSLRRLIRSCGPQGHGDKDLARLSPRPGRAPDHLGSSYHRSERRPPAASLSVSEGRLGFGAVSPAPPSLISFAPVASLLSEGSTPSSSSGL